MISSQGHLITRQLPFLRSLAALTKRDFKLKYVGSVLGAYWHVIYPLVMIAIYTVIFSNLMKVRLGGVNTSKFAYALYLCSGLLAWNFFFELVSRGCITLSDNKDFIKKLSFQPYILFFAASLASFLNFLIAFALYTMLLIFTDPPSLLGYLGSLSLVVLLAVFATALATMLGCLNVFIKDVYYATQIIFQIWFWATPIVYLHDSLPEFAKTLVYFNPLYAFIEPMHDMLFFHQTPSFGLLGLALGWTALAVGISALVYRASISYLRDQI